MAEKKIDGETYRCNPMAASEALELYADLLRVATGGTGRLPDILFALAGKAAGEVGAGEFAETAALAAIGDILSKNTSGDLRSLLERVLAGAEVRRSSGFFDRFTLDDEFSGRLGAILPVARFVLEVNFADFFPASAGSGILSRLGEALAKAK